MFKTLMASLAFLMALQVSGLGQGNSIRARMSGNSGGDGKCTFEVEVDGAAEVQIRGDQGYLRTLSGSPASWRRLDCNQVLPRNPGDFRFRGIDGRGRQDLVRDPNSNGGTAVIRIEDPTGGREGYTGDIEWRGGYGTSNPDGGFSSGNWTRGSYGSRGSNGAFRGNSGEYWDGEGWKSGWGNGIRFSGHGDGRFDRDGGPRYDLRGVKVNIARSNGEVDTVFDTNEGRSTLHFIGNISRINDKTIEAYLVSGNHRSVVANANGRMKIRMNSDRSVRSIDIDGDVDNGKFSLDWRD